MLLDVGGERGVGKRVIWMSNLYFFIKKLDFNCGTIRDHLNFT